MRTTEAYPLIRSAAERWQQVLLAMAMATYCVAVFLATVSKYHYLAMGYDLAFNEQAIWNTVHGRILQISGVDYAGTILGNDQFLFYLLLAPLYAVVPSTYTLFALATLAAALGALPLFLLARLRLGKGLVPLLLALAYLAHPALQNPNLYEFQVRIFASTFLMFALYFLEIRALWPMVIFLALAASTRTDVGLPVGGLGVYAFLTGKEKRLALLPFMLGALFFLSGTLLVVPSFSSARSFTFLSHYIGLVEGGLPGLVSELFRMEKARYLLLLFGSFAFLPLASPLEVLPAVPTLGLNLLSPRAIQWDLNHQYQLTVLPFLFAGTVRTLERMRNLNLRLLGAAVVVLAVILVTYFAGGSQVLGYLKRGMGPSTEFVAAKELAMRIPDGAFVAASNLLAPLAMPRRGLVLLARNPLNSMDPLRSADYILLDSSDRPSMRVIEEEGVLKDPAWQLLDKRGRFVLLQRAGAAP